MAALALTLTNVKRMAMGNMWRTSATLTVVASTSTYTANGEALPTGWRNTLNVPNHIQSVSMLEPLMASTPELALAGKIDTTNGKLIVIGGGPTAAEDVPLDELPNATSIADATYSGQIVAVGY